MCNFLVDHVTHVAAHLAVVMVTTGRRRGVVRATVHRRHVTLQVVPAVGRIRARVAEEMARGPRRDAGRSSHDRPRPRLPANEEPRLLLLLQLLQTTTTTVAVSYTHLTLPTNREV